MNLDKGLVVAVTKKRLALAYFLGAVVFTAAKWIINKEYHLLWQGAPVILTGEALFIAGGACMLLAAGKRLWSGEHQKEKLLENARQVWLAELGLSLNWAGALIFPSYVLYLQLDAYPFTDWSQVGLWTGEVIAVFGLRVWPLAKILVRHREVVHA